MPPKPTKLEWLIQAIQSHNNSDACLLWPSHWWQGGGGYGKLIFEGRGVLAHRLAFKIAYSHWPTPIGRHSCDTPACFNARHILEGTHLSNRQDAVIRGRTSKGEDRTLAKLNADLVRKIRAEYVRGKAGHGCAVLARKYGVSETSIRGVVNGKIWRHVL